MVSKGVIVWEWVNKVNINVAAAEKLSTHSALCQILFHIFQNGSDESDVEFDYDDTDTPVAEIAGIEKRDLCYIL